MCESVIIRSRAQKFKFYLKMISDLKRLYCRWIIRHSHLFLIVFPDVLEKSSTLIFFQFCTVFSMCQFCTLLLGLNQTLISDRSINSLMINWSTTRTVSCLSSSRLHWSQMFIKIPFLLEICLTDSKKFFYPNYVYYLIDTLVYSIWRTTQKNTSNKRNC